MMPQDGRSLGFGMEFVCLSDRRKGERLIVLFRHFDGHKNVQHCSLPQPLAAPSTTYS